MARPKNVIPRYTRHMASGQAQVCWTDALGRRRSKTLPGPYDSPESKAAYARLVTELQVQPLAVAGGQSPYLADVLVAFLLYAQRQYAGEDTENPSSELRHFKTAIRHVRELYPDVLAADFGPLALKAVPERFVEQGWGRATVNRQTKRVVHIFRWAVGEELVGPDVHRALDLVLPLRRGATRAGEATPRTPVPEAVVEATLPFLNRHVAGLVRLQLLTGCRPGEVMRITRSQIETAGSAWVYRPRHHKMSHKGHARDVPLGPQARQLLAEFFTDDPDDYLFSPRRAVQEVRLKRAEERRTPRYPSQDRRREATKKEEPRRKPSSRYQRQSYLNAVIRACDRAFPAPAPLGRAEGESVAAWRARLTADQRAALRPVFVVLAAGCSALFLLGPLAVAVFLVVFAPANVSTYLAPGAVGFAAVMAWAMSSSVQWVELDGGVLRARRLLTRRIVTHRVSDIVAVEPLHSTYVGPLENALADMMMGTSNRGYELRFRDASKLGLVRGDMKGLDQFLRVLAAEIAARCGPLEGLG
ncbi:tyrosine-type recombinase/integrase [Gemmata sp.]|uniref:tyrosine-type recombinase/integrase n=1 Tax=Gemmata sp. TaxID=1914242 RepID=UPI003F725700